MNKKLKFIFFCFLFFSCYELSAEEYSWLLLYHPEPKHASPELACRWVWKKYYDYDDLYYLSVRAEDERNWTCVISHEPYEDETSANSPIVRLGDGCPLEKFYNPLNGQCEHHKNEDTCPSSTAGNPINFSSGYKTQAETDFSAAKTAAQSSPIEFSRFYSSAHGRWTHSYSSRLIVEGSTTTVIHADGRVSIFEKSADSHTPKPPEVGSLTQGDDTFIYSSPGNEFLTFDNTGKLLSIRKNGISQHLKYTEDFVEVLDDFGFSLKFTEDARRQPLSLATEHVNILYEYNTYIQLKSVIRNYPDRSERRKYFYEDPNDSRLLTAIEDERGVRYATWTYDNQSRAISSEHSNGAQKITVDYNDDGSSTVTNELGKKTHYQFELVGGTKRIKSIDGEPSPNCPDSQSTFAYDEQGFLKSKTDNKGNVTAYTRNTRGLETSRTEASGTPDARTISTEWHPTLFSPIRVTEPDRAVQYTYDPQGRPLSQTITPR
ncbi:DUF6531 domain-containing protein [Pseudomonas sp. MWU13-2100]|uniref:DUF6531 domain-containing protein n=1 Tax=Pseudomonas sp. MWU13-2100 TaxID=2935075 RepID=UPI0020109295|nr:DUF6531 domain-containing protein [Pseudomonas sp. MWU13-2100]